MLRFHVVDKYTIFYFGGMAYHRSLTDIGMPPQISTLPDFTIFLYDGVVFYCGPSLQQCPGSNPDFQPGINEITLQHFRLDGLV
jgi:hypothetical protein